VSGRIVSYWMQRRWWGTWCRRAGVVLDALAGAEVDGRAAQAVALLALIAGQDVEPAEGSDGTDGRWRIARKVAADRVVSTVDPDSRHVHKSRH